MLSADNMLITEQSLLRVPLEGMRKAYRGVSKQVDKDISAAETMCKKGNPGGSTSRAERLKAAEAAIARMTAVKSRVGSSSPRHAPTPASLLGLSKSQPVDRDSALSCGVISLR